jgi:hypothetical protein
MRMFGKMVWLGKFTYTADAVFGKMVLFGKFAYTAEGIFGKMVWFGKFTYTADGIFEMKVWFGKFTWFVITSQTPSQASTKNSSSAGFLSFRTIKCFKLL